MQDYKRLTERDEYGIAIYKQKCDADSFEENLYIHAKREEAVVNRLAELEDKIENGTLIELPCKVGRIVYYVADLVISKFFQTRIVYDIVEMPFTLDMLGTYQNRWFLTKAEAEKKLKELQEQDK